jgi:hypothetical protein
MEETTLKTRMVHFLEMIMNEIFHRQLSVLIDDNYQCLPQLRMASSPTLSIRPLKRSHKYEHA